MRHDTPELFEKHFRDASGATTSTPSPKSAGLTTESRKQPNLHHQSSPGSHVPPSGAAHSLTHSLDALRAQLPYIQHTVHFSKSFERASAWLFAPLNALRTRHRALEKKRSVSESKIISLSEEKMRLHDDGDKVKAAPDGQSKSSLEATTVDSRSDQSPRETFLDKVFEENEEFTSCTSTSSPSSRCGGTSTQVKKRPQRPWLRRRATQKPLEPHGSDGSSLTTTMKRMKEVLKDQRK